MMAETLPSGVVVRDYGPSRSFQYYFDNQKRRFDIDCQEKGVRFFSWSDIPVKPSQLDEIARGLPHG